MLRLTFILCFLLVTIGLEGASEQKPPVIWKRLCISCHGMNGEVTDAGKAVGARNLTDAEYIKTRSDEQMKKAILEGAKNEEGVYTMIPYKQMLKKGDLEALISFIRSLSKE